MTEKIVIDSQHSEVGPSASDRWIPCPGSVFASRNVDDPDSWFAAEGNAAHELSEWCRVHKCDASTYRGQVIVVGKYEFTVDQEMIDGVNEFVEYVEQWPGLPLYEERVSYEEIVPGGFGTTDDARLLDYLCRVTDLKYGKGIQVFAKENTQLMLYALGIYLQWRHLFEFKDFILTIHQPRLNHVDVWEISLTALLAWAHRVAKPAGARALQPGAPLVAGEHCIFCPARRICKVRAEYVTREAIGDFKNLDAEPVSAFLTNEEIGLILPKIANFKKWCNDIEAQAYSEIAKGNRIPHPETGDYKLVEGRSNRVLKLSEAETVATLALEGFTDIDKLYKKELHSAPQLEKIVGKKIMSDLIFKPKGKPKIAPGTDKRQTLAVDPTAEFENLDADD